MADNPDSQEKAEKAPESPSEAVVATDDFPPQLAGPVHKKPANSKLKRLKNWYLSHKKISIPLSALVVIFVLAIIPWSRYQAAGLLIKQNYTLKVLDSSTGTPVSGVTVKSGRLSAETGSNGAVTLRLKPGASSFSFSKKYYQVEVAKLTVPILKQKNTPAIKLVATGRQVKISLTNLINKTPIENASIKIAGTTAKTDQSGAALVVVPVGLSSYQVTLSAAGYKDATVTVKASGQQLVTNDFSLTPSGEIYFLSNQSGNIDVVKTNLDGSNRQTVLAGTGNEDANNTMLVASPDWKYIALLSRRSGSKASVYVIDASNDKTTTIDSGDADFSLVGWSGDTLVYKVNRDTVQDWQPDQQALKSYNAGTAKITVLDQTQGSGTNQYDYMKEQFGSIYIIGNQVFYPKNWYAGYNSWSQLNSKQATLNSVNIDGSGQKTIKNFGVGANTQTSDIWISTELYQPGVIGIYFSLGSSGSQFFKYSGGQVKDDPSQTQDGFYNSNQNYATSPSGNKALWSEVRDGKTVVIVGDQNGNNSKEVASLDQCQVYGWYTDNYVLLTKGGNEFYIMPADGSNQPIKISDYHTQDYYMTANLYY